MPARSSVSRTTPAVPPNMLCELTARCRPATRPAAPFLHYRGRIRVRLPTTKWRLADNQDNELRDIQGDCGSLRQGGGLAPKTLQRLPPPCSPANPDPPTPVPCAQPVRRVKKAASEDAAARSLARRGGGGITRQRLVTLSVQVAIAGNMFLAGGPTGQSPDAAATCNSVVNVTD